MNRLGLRLSLGGGREALVRHAVIASGVAIGVALLLFMISGLKLLGGTMDRPCWRCTGQTTPAEQGNATTDPLHWRWSETIHNAKIISLYSIAQTGPNSPQIPGIERLPGPGEYYASPALAALLAETPDDQLDNRFPGKLVGHIGRAGLDGPKDLVAVVGYTPAGLPLTPIEPGEQLPVGANSFTYNVWKVNDQPAKRDYGLIITSLFGVGVIGLLIGVITLITTATRLSASRREEKFAALRLLGATPRQVIRFAAIDAAVGATAGAILGLGLFYLVRPLLVSGLSLVETASFFPEDLNPGVYGLVGVLAGTPLLAAGAAIASLRRVRISPLGVSRKTTPKPPRVWRLLPLAAGLALLLGVWIANRDIVDTVARSRLMPYFLIGSALILFGLVIAGPWLTQLATRLLARRARSAASLLAFRRLADNPGAAFRPANVLVIAAFLCTLFAALTPMILNTGNTNYLRSDRSEQIILDQYFTYSGGKPSAGTALSTLQPALDTLSAIPGVNPVVAYNPSNTATDSNREILISCNDLPRLHEPPCEPGNTAVKLSIGFGGIFGVPISESESEQVAIPAENLKHKPILKLLIGIEGGQVAVDRVRTVMAQYPDLFSDAHFMIMPEFREQERQIITSIRYMVNGAFLVVLFVACCSLAVGVGGGLVERKRPFGLLRVAGTSLGQLRRVVLIESATPLLAAVLLAALLGFGTAVSLVESFASKHDPGIQALPADYYLAMGLGIGVTLVAALATLPLLAAITKPENVRFE